MATLAQLAAAAGVAPAELHAQHMPALLATLVEGRRFEAWDVHASEWHLLQAQPRIPTGRALTLTYRLRSPTARAQPRIPNARALSPDPKPEPEPEPEP